MSAIKVENISKRYVIGHQGRADTLRDALTGGLSGLWRLLRRDAMEREEFWALREVSFEVSPGEVIGIIGRNGAGKSTLLKILSRITEPTEGRIAIKGRVASLLEVGTGFHPELSGRENIYLNGAILGMRRAEIRKRFDEIVAFSEVERFLDTPVKRYSSGMYVRLAFAVAAHLEPEILIVDEVLAVGDAQFQQKCLGKMQDVAKQEGRTVLFVSHNLFAVASLCTRAILLREGRVHYSGRVPEAIDKYLSPTTNQSTSNATARLNSSIAGMRVLRQDGTPAINFQMEEDIVLEIGFHPASEVANINVGISLNSTRDGNRVFGTTSQYHELTAQLGPQGGTAVLRIVRPRFAPGTYSLDVGLVWPDGKSELAKDLCIIIVDGSLSRLKMDTRSDVGVYLPEHKWSLSAELSSPVGPSAENQQPPKG